jgi:integrase
MGRRATWPPKAIPHRASGRDRVQWRGRTYYLGPIGSPESRAAYCELIRKLSGQPAIDGSGALPENPPPGEGTVAQLVALWHAHASREHTPEECRSYRYSLIPVVRLYGDSLVEQFDALALRRVQQQMAETLCRNQVNRRIVRIRTVWRWAEMEKLAAPGSWAALRAVPPLTRPRPGLKESQKVRPVEWWRLARTAYLGASPGLRLLILLGWWTGARPSELASLRAEWIDTSSDVWTASLERHKTAWRGHTRTLHFGPQAQELLAPRLAELGGAGVLCPDGRGNHFSRRGLLQAVVRACDRAGVTRWHCYQWRHACKQRLVRLVGLDATRSLLGQRSLSSTEQYAAGVDAQAATESARKAG